MFCSVRRFHNYETEYVARLRFFYFFFGRRTTDTTSDTPDSAMATNVTIIAQLNLRPSAMCP